MVRTPKSLCEWHEQPVNLLEQPFLFENVNVQILSPNNDRVKTISKYKKHLTFVFFYRIILLSILIMILCMANRSQKKL